MNQNRPDGRFCDILVFRLQIPFEKNYSDGLLKIGQRHYDAIDRFG